MNSIWGSANWTGTRNSRMTLALCGNSKKKKKKRHHRGAAESEFVNFRRIIGLSLAL